MSGLCAATAARSSASVVTALLKPTVVPIRFTILLVPPYRFLNRSSGDRLPTVVAATQALVVEAPFDRVAGSVLHRFFLAALVVLFCGYSVSGGSRRFLARIITTLGDLAATADQTLVLVAPLDCLACAILHLASSLLLLSFSSVATVSQAALAGFSPELSPR